MKLYFLIIDWRFGLISYLRTYLSPISCCSLFLPHCYKNTKTTIYLDSIVPFRIRFRRLELFHWELSSLRKYITSEDLSWIQPIILSMVQDMNHFALSPSNLWSSVNILALRVVNIEKTHSVETRTHNPQRKSLVDTKRRRKNEEMKYIFVPLCSILLCWGNCEVPCWDLDKGASTRFMGHVNLMVAFSPLHPPLFTFSANSLNKIRRENKAQWVHTYGMKMNVLT